MKLWKKSTIILSFVVLIWAIPIIILKNTDFNGSDNQAAAVITQIDKDYRPWFSSLFQPGKETESMLFALQAAIGAGVLGFGFGRLSVRRPDCDQCLKRSGGSDEQI